MKIKMPLVLKLTSLACVALVLGSLRSLAAAPVVTTLAPGNVTATNALLNGMVNPGGSLATAWFQYSTTAPSWVLNGGCGLTGNQLNLTDTNVSEARSAFLNGPQPITQFSASFVYQDVGGGAGNGVAFGLQKAPAGANALGGNGGNLGYAGITPSFALELNLYTGSPGGTGFALATNGLVAQTGGPAYASTSPVNLKSGDPIQVTLVYNNPSLVVTLTDLSTRASFTNTASINLPAILGGTNAYVGFTAATGAATAVQVVSNFVYNAQSGFGLSLATAPATLPATNTTLAVSNLISGLAPATTYYVQMVASNSAGTVVGTNLTFTTTPLAPVVTTLAASSVAATNATLNGTVNPGYGATTAWFHYTTAPLGWVLNGGSALNVNSNQLTLTDNNINETNSAFLYWPQSITQFSASFVYKDVGGGAGNGTAFVLQNAPAGENALGGDNGAGLGYAGITPSFALELNLYTGSPGGTGFALATNGLVAQTGGHAYTNTSPVNLKSGDPIQVTLVYNNPSLVVTLTDLSTRASFTNTASINLPAILGGTNAYVGFTAATGDATAVQVVSNFVYNGLAPLGTTPLSTTLPVVLPATNTTLAVANLISGLAPATTYYFQLAASNGAGMVVGSDLTFSTPPLLPVVTALSATSVTATNVTLNGTVNPGNGVTTTWFQYATTPLAWLLNGGAVLTSNQLTLTDGNVNETNSAFLNVPQPIAQFAASFVYQDVGGGAGNGTALVLQNAPAGANALGGGNGAGLGYAGITPSLALELNLYGYSPGGTGLAWATNGLVAQTGGAAYTNTSPVNLTSGDPIQVTVVYANPNLMVTLTDLNTGASYTNATSLNLPAILGNTNAYVGFTAASGDATAVQVVSDFVYNGQSGFGLSLTTAPLTLAATNATLAMANLISSLVPATTYYFQLVASNSLSTTFGSTLSFPTASRSSAQAVGFNLAAAQPVAAGGAFQLGFTNLTGLAFTVLGTTNLAMPLTNWTVLGPAVESPAGSGQYQFTDPQITNTASRFYRVVSP